jgi:hypothetical protein
MNANTYLKDYSLSHSSFDLVARIIYLVYYRSYSLHVLENPDFSAARYCSPTSEN